MQNDVLKYAEVAKELDRIQNIVIRVGWNENKFGIVLIETWDENGIEMSHKAFLNRIVK